MDNKQQPGILFKGVQLLDIAFKVRGEVPKPIPLGPKFNMEARFSEDGTKLDPVLSVDMFGNVAEEQRPDIDLAFTLIGGFERVEEGNVSLREFAEYNAPAYLIPYLRELLANITTRSPLPLLNIGPINIIALAKEGKAKLIMGQSEKKPQQL